MIGLLFYYHLIINSIIYYICPFVKNRVCKAIASRYTIVTQIKNHLKETSKNQPDQRKFQLN